MNGTIRKAAAWLVVIALVLAMMGCGTAETSQSTEGTGADTEAVESNASEPESETAEGTSDSKKDEMKSETTGVEKEEASEDQTADSEKGEDAIAEQDTVQIDDGHEKAADAVQNMKIGWNLGNSFDATGDWIPQSAGGAIEKYETAWGNPLTPSTLMPKLKNLGFQAVRIPVTWNHHFDKEGNIDAEWMARVKEVVDWAMEADLYCIINVHHDTGAEYSWLRSTKANYEKNNVIFAKLWEQIATEFRDYPDRLVFEGFNEMLDERPEWSNPDAESVEVINLYNQLFVDTVRSTGGNNEVRNLICCTYAAATTDSAIDGFKLPEDSAQGHLIAEVHFYAPYEFITDEGITWTTPIKEYTDYVEEQIDVVFSRLAKRFTDQNVPLIIGEFATDDKGNTEDRVKWYTHVIEKANEINATCFMWDNGNGFNMGHIDRVGNDDAFPQIIEACVETAE